VNPVHIIGVGMPRFGKYLERGVKQLAAEALDLALADAGLAVGDVEAVWFANSAWGLNGGQDCVRGQVALRPAGVDRVPIHNVENACAGGATALHGAYLAVAAGACDVALAIGVEKMFQQSRLRMMAAFLGGLDVGDLAALGEQARELRARYPAPDSPAPARRGRASSGPARRERGGGSRWRKLAGLPALARDLLVIADHYQLDLGALLRAGGGSGGNSGQRSAFMDIYAIAARRHMAQHGSTARQLAAIAAKNHEHGALNPRAQYRESMTIDEVLAAPPVAFPLTRPMCAPIGDGSAAAIVCSAAAARRLGGRRAVRVRASLIGSGRTVVDGEPGITERVSRIAYRAAGVGPTDIDLAEVHDATAFGELHQTEALGFCAPGEGGRLAEAGDTRLGGGTPINTSGGLEARGHPIAASGLAQIVELVDQLRGEAGPRQVDGARLALAQNGGGMVGGEEAAMGIHILEAPAGA